MALDLLVIAPHPDDGELGCGGLLARARAEGQSTGVLDLTRGEMGSKGDATVRAQEAAEAARILGLDYRGNLGLPDGGLADTEPQRRTLAEALRALAPRVVLAPLEADRHPDHTAAHRLVLAAVHLARLPKAPLGGRPHRVEHLFFYPGNYPAMPNLAVDVTEFIGVWEAAVRVYRSQFEGERVSETVHEGGVEARLALRRYWGNLLGVGYAEPLVSPLPWLFRPW
ncbi:MAG: bacillithiol biosynthesis deacetylase BshB1 [Meiothermus sp.]|uniref:bacillithiol biosynthesis deacetylase BshB1 n=1 Tax=Meiothermus sp. TaxID=1955249 RepID=UPI0025DA23B6|nr:bacillithiol biosynthesis deacetylase BshB1 [Meiothermus sp.]MCS7058275.1 bacillithiol biosynthesis deacetylase BshB1 [Meiothermus sp.]MCS7193571.1 bacillithiol biosynthesis deacetylase BshB1 [Meiothermus sp.]MCX7739839.1 bacillithiol biosynthesis deacetylase BshB1 [Meiothermus sp.]MDW8090584.1 bacillithiol biosynthesis deacetylase BshB1 [Meiothermus sp.]MDW8480500.1 bacillithiol biosynthesis deacetylase BshB1 [Meiothermus sp.]